MKSKSAKSAKSMVALVLALSLLPWSVARADGDDHHDRGEHRGQAGGDRGGDRGGNWDHRDHRDHRDYVPRGFDAHRGAGPNHEFYRGDRLASEYRHPNYVVDDWRGHHLSAPPRGYHWVQSGGDYILVAIATGVIMQLLLNN
jgi:Ni/Co efflux regulator RcnB